MPATFYYSGRTTAVVKTDRAAAPLSPRRSAIDRSHVLGELQYAIMRVLWDAGEATVAQVRDALSDRPDRALTTVATMLSKMERKGVVGHRVEGRQYVYRALVSEADVARSMVLDLTNLVFDGDPAALVSHLLEQHEIDPQELARLIEIVRERDEEDAS